MFPRTISFRTPKLGVPQPVTASHPIDALNPSVPQPGLFPTVISLKPEGAFAPMAYIKGLRNPSGASPLASRASFKRETMPVNVGDEADVPPMR